MTEGRPGNIPTHGIRDHADKKLGITVRRPEISVDARQYKQPYVLVCSDIPPAKAAGLPHWGWVQDSEEVRRFVSRRSPENDLRFGPCPSGPVEDSGS